MHEQQFNHPPLLVLNSFGTQGMHVKLMATMFQNLFPSINVHTVGGPDLVTAAGDGWAVGKGAGITGHTLCLHRLERLTGIKQLT